MRITIHMDEPKFIAHCEKNAHKIFVREQIGGKWGAYALSILEEETRSEHIRRLYSENRMPVMIS